MSWALTGLLTACAAVAFCAPARASERRDEQAAPTLRLAIDRPVQAGERLSLHWEGADESIQELEIQLSVDGGRTWSICISPSLDPRSGKYDWTVPKLGGSEAMLRIRFNRGGRELEGEAMRLSTFLREGCELPESAVLPRDAESESERAPKPAGPGGANSTTRGPSASYEAQEQDGSRPSSSSFATLDVAIAQPFDGVAPSRVPPTHPPLRFVPPRK